MYPSLEEVVIYNSEFTENLVSKEPIFFDTNILCCPYCGNKNVHKNGFKHQKQRYRCRNKNCEVSFVDPKQRKYPPRIRVEKRNYKKSPKIESILCRFCNRDNCLKVGFNQRGEQIYKCRDCQRKFQPGATKDRPERLPISEDVWSVADLGVKVLGTNVRTKFNFTNIHQLWLRDLAKKFIKFAASLNRANSTMQDYITHLNKFSVFLYERYPEITSMEEIDRELIIDYRSWLNTFNFSITTLNERITTLKIFIKTGNINKWLATDSYLFLEEDRVKEPKNQPRFIPEYILKQLDKHKYQLPLPLQRMVSVIREIGVRYSTLATIPFDCLELDNNHKWWIKIYRVKIVEETQLPISEELAQEIKQQQHFLRQYFDKNEYLFTAREPGSKTFIPVPHKVMSTPSFCRYLNVLARSCDIKDENGKIWNFTSHQFRHTFATEAINNGVPQHILQKLLGHESSEMTSRYAHIYDETLRKELDRFHQNRTIDITGQIVELELESDSQDLKWFTKEISAIALPNGYCGRPKMLGDCDIAGDVGCYICPHFRTSKTFLDIHKDQLERINKVLDKAHRYNWQLPIKKNEPIKQNLKLIISTLEADNNE